MTTQIISAQVIIDSVDESANITGTIEIDIDSGKARTATFSLLPALGLTDLIAWVNKSVVIKSVLNSNIKTEFTGLISKPIYDITTGVTGFLCTDNMQERFETIDQAAIAVITGGYWSESAFNESDGWEYAQERLSTIQSDLEMDELNNFRTTAWAAKAIPDYTFNTSDYIDGSLVVESIADRRSIINGVNVELEYRYKRLKQREQAYSWLDAGIVCEFYTNPYPLPTQQRVLDAIIGTGWEITSQPVFTLPPVSGSYDCTLYGAPLVVWLQNTTLAQGVDFSIAKRYTQNITEKYTIRIESADSTTALGDISVNKTASLNIDYDSTDWEASLVANGFTDFGTPLTDINSDEYINKDDSTERQNSIDTVVNLYTTKIIESHRNTVISFELPYNQNIDTIHTSRVINPLLTAKGKISRVLKRINTESAESTVKVTIKLIKPFGVGIPSADDPIVTPDGLPTVTDIQTADLNLLSHLGGQDATAYDPLWGGWVTDYDVITEPGHIPYPTEFNVNTPKITLNSIDNVDALDSSLINVIIPDDELL